MELFIVQSGARIAHVHRIDVSEKYASFSATCGRDTLLEMSYKNDESVRMNRLRDDRLEELARIRLQSPKHLLWVGDRLLVTEWNQNCHAVTELN